MNALSFKCPNCGGELTYEPSSRKYICPYCRSSFTQQQLDELTAQEEQREQDHAAQQGRQEKQEDYSAREGKTGQGYSSSEGHSGQNGSAWEKQSEQERSDRNDQGASEAVVYTCPNCGAELITSPTTAATYCYYCHNPVILSGRVSGAFAPDGIIPFQFNRKQAEDAFREYVKGKRFVPRAFRDESQIAKMQGVYYPFWVYDCDVDADYHAEGTRIRVWRAGDTEFTETSVYEVDRAGQVFVKNLTKNALSKSDRELVDNVQPFEIGGAVPFKMSYLSGFFAEKRDTEKEHFSVETERETIGYAEEAVKATAVGYTVLRGRSSHFQTSKRVWRYVLLPVWVLTYQTRGGRVYFFTMNGQSGKVAGRLPLDRVKLFLWSLMAAAVVFGLALLGGYWL